MKRIEQDFYILWTVPPGEDVPFEVSREVATPLMPLCQTSPFCPKERTPRLTGQPTPDGGERRASVVTYEPNPDFEFDPADCPYQFVDKEDCYRAINKKALREGCIPEAELARIANFLKAMGYRVQAERVSASDLEGERILMAHGPIYNFHELRCENGPGGLVLYLIRNPREDARPPGCRDL
jgi:hypothetical protein